MGFLYPGALAFFALLPLLIVAYLVRERPRRVVVSSVLGFRALRGLRAERLWGRPRFDWLFLFELLLLALAVMAMAQPYVLRNHTPVAVVIDNSALMQVRGTQNHSWFEEARSRLLDSLPAGTGVAVTVYVTAPAPHAIASAVTPGRAREIISNLSPSDAPNGSGGIGRIISELVKGRKFARIFYAGARPLAAPLPSIVHAIAVGESVPNFALASFTVSGKGFGASTLDAHVTLGNFSSKPRELTVEVTGDGKPIAHAQVKLAPRELKDISLPALPRADVYRAELTPSDAFPLDNVAYATSALGEQIRVLFVSPTPADAGGLSALPGLKVSTVLPQDYSPRAAKADLLIFEYAAPKELPPANAMMVMPPGATADFGLKLAPGETTQIASWRSPDPLTNGVNFLLLSLGHAQSYDSVSWLQPVVRSNLGGLILAGRHQGHRYVVTGINPFPYLGRHNLPMSILTLNMLGYLSGFGAKEAGYRTGQPFVVPAGVTAITPPGGKPVEVVPGTLFDADQIQGLYELSGTSAAARYRAVNLDNLSVSDLQEIRPVTVASSRPTGTAADFSSRLTLTPWLLAALLVLAVFEALFTYRRRRGASQVAA